MSQLADRSCTPCRKGTPPLAAEAVQGLLGELEGWEAVQGHHLARTFRFPDFKEALAFVNRVGEVAEAERHHPELVLNWGRVEVRVWTHSIDGLSESDFVLAAKVDRLARDGGAA
jgi:4a-hydroxytetrahydrobiopterin dehydratase